MEVATWLSMLALATTRAIERSDKEVRVILSRAWICVLRHLLFLLEIWKEKWLEKMLIMRWPGLNSLLNRSKERKTSLNILSMLTTNSLIFNCCSGVRLFSDSQWEMVLDDELVSRRDLKMWLLKRSELWAVVCYWTFEDEV